MSWSNSEIVFRLIVLAIRSIPRAIEQFTCEVIRTVFNIVQMLRK